MCVEVYIKFVLRLLLYVRFGGVFELTKIVVIVLANAVREHLKVFLFLTDCDFCPVFRL